MNKRNIVFGTLLFLIILLGADYFIPIDSYTTNQICGGGDIRYSLIFGGSTSFSSDKARAIEREKMLDAQSSMTVGGCFNSRVGKLLLL